jgi:hypothetical protein
MGAILLSCIAGDRALAFRSQGVVEELFLLFRVVKLRVLVS